VVHRRAWWSLFLIGLAACGSSGDNDPAGADTASSANAGDAAPSMVTTQADGGGGSVRHTDDASGTAALDGSDGTHSDGSTDAHSNGSDSASDHATQTDASSASDGSTTAHDAATSIGADATTALDASSGASLGDARRICVETINNYRASVGLPPLQEWKSAESCVDGQAKKDGDAQEPHTAVLQCGESAQNECLDQSDPSQAIVACLGRQWAEGPGSGESHVHYTNLTANYTKVACGFYRDANGNLWSTQDFR
jgi:hypothetical protein